MPSAAGACRVSELAPTQALWRPAQGLSTHPDCHGKEGVAGSSPAEGSRILSPPAPLLVVLALLPAALAAAALG
jgi:hypothetical protein